MTKLTTKQQLVFDFVRQYIATSGLPPTRAEIATSLGFKSNNAAEEHLKALARKGALELLPGTSRGIRLTQQEIALPIVGRVAAGNPILAKQHIEFYYDIPGNMFHPNADYLLRVQGDSMQNAGILDADLLAVHKSPTAENGQIVVARINDEVTVKRFKQTDAIITLQAENPDFSPIIIDLQYQSFDIEGIGVGIIRNQGLG